MGSNFEKGTEKNNPGNENLVVYEYKKEAFPCRKASFITYKNRSC